MTENKFDKMMHAYCDRDVESFEFKEKRPTLKYTSVLAATLAIAILVPVLIAPNSSQKNDFTLTVSAADTVNYNTVKFTDSGEDGELHLEPTGDVETINTCPPLIVEGDNIEKVFVYSENENIAIAYSAKNYNVTDKYHYENFPTSKDVPDPLIVIPYEKNSVGELVEVNLDTLKAREQATYTYAQIIDINRNTDEKYIVVKCYPVDKNGEPLMIENYSPEYNDKVTVEVTYLDGEIQNKHAVISYKNGEMVFEIVS